LLGIEYACSGVDKMAVVTFVVVLEKLAVRVSEGM